MWILFSLETSHQRFLLLDASRTTRTLILIVVRLLHSGMMKTFHGVFLLICISITGSSAPAAGGSSLEWSRPASKRAAVTSRCDLSLTAAVQSCFYRECNVNPTFTAFGLRTSCFINFIKTRPRARRPVVMEMQIAAMLDSTCLLKTYVVSLSSSSGQQNL